MPQKTPEPTPIYDKLAQEYGFNPQIDRIFDQALTEKLEKALNAD